MSTIRKQSIISSVVVYAGFALGIFNMYLFTRQGGFTKEQFGLTGGFIAVANIMFSVASFATPSYVAKFFPYYKAHAPGKNDMLTWALLVPVFGFLVVTLLCIAFKGIVIDKIFSNSPQLPYYFYWIFPFGLGYTLFMVLEAYAWQQRKAVFSNFMKEVGFRLFVTVLILLTTAGVIRSFDGFIKIYAFAYLFIVLIVIFHFSRQGRFTLSFSVSRVTRKFFKKILTLISYVWGGSLIYNLANVFDTIVIAAVLPNGLAAAAIFTFAQNMSSLIQAPQRAVISSSMGPLSQAWKDKDLSKINRIYHRSSINQLLFSCAMFSLIWLNFTDGIHTFQLQGDYEGAKMVFLFLGLTRIIDMGTGVNAQIIGTSTLWKFEFISGMVLLALSLGLNYQLTRHYGIFGPAVSNLIAFTIYNAIRCWFLWKKFRMQPFTAGTLYTILVTAGCFAACWYLFHDKQGILWIVIRSALFTVLFVGCTLLLKLSPDVLPVWLTVRKRLGLGNGSRS
ncbi:MAG TPA: oligosaccharide flippase family protein [Flavisolibacter sp.]|jgi:O-antigen/teichoic acid export membrane protein|nr:oligosaccharide flippase family protein [Flavisolibacter sp.]